MEVGTDAGMDGYMGGNSQRTMGGTKRHEAIMICKNEDTL
jgi:hypothetical protein